MAGQTGSRNLFAQSLYGERQGGGGKVFSRARRFGDLVKGPREGEVAPNHVRVETGVQPSSDCDQLPSSSVHYITSRKRKEQRCTRII